MVDFGAAKTALVVSGALLTLLFLGAVFRFATRIASYATIVFLVIAAGYVAYELYSGWTADSESVHSTDQVEAADDSSQVELDSVEAETVDETLTDEEFDQELNQLLDEENAETDIELNTE